MSLEMSIELQELHGGAGLKGTGLEDQSPQQESAPAASHSKVTVFPPVPGWIDTVCLQEPQESRTGSHS